MTWLGSLNFSGKTQYSPLCCAIYLPFFRARLDAWEIERRLFFLRFVILILFLVG